MSSPRLLLVTLALLVTLPATLASANAPLNDKRSQPATINSNGGSLNGDTTFATLAGNGAYPADWEGDKPGSGTHSVWYRWTAPQNGRVVVSVDSFAFDPVVSVHPIADGSIWRSDPNLDSDGDASVVFYVRAGQQWDVKVDGRTAAQYGSFKVTAAFDSTPPAPANDAFSNPESLGTGTSAKRSELHTLFATKDALETSHRGVNTAHSVWFTWTPANNGGTRINLDCGWSAALFSDDPVVAVYKGSSLTGLKATEVAYYSTTPNGADCPRGTVTFPAIAGQTYRIAVDAGPGVVGEQPLELTQETAKPVVTFAPNPVYGPNQIVDFDGEAKNECKLDGNDVGCAGSQVKLSGAKDGPHKLEVRTTDTYGNVSNWTTKFFEVETQAPETTITAAPGAQFGGGTPKIEFTADKAATFECKMDAKNLGIYADCKSGWQPLWQADGQAVTVSVRAKDAYGNVEATPETRSWVVDTKAPVFATQYAHPQSPVGSPITWTWSTNEPATFECSLTTGGPFKPCTSPHTEPGLDTVGGRHLTIRATDGAGNVTISQRYGYHSPLAKTTTTTTKTPTTTTTGTTNGTTRTTVTPRFLLSLRTGARSITKKRLAKIGLPFEARCRPSCVMTVRLVNGRTILATVRTRSKGTLKLGPAGRSALRKVRKGAALAIIASAPGTTTTGRVRIAG